MTSHDFWNTSSWELVPLIFKIKTIGYYCVCLYAIKLNPMVSLITSTLDVGYKIQFMASIKT